MNISPLWDLYPEVETYSSRFIRPLDGTEHQIYVEECGNPKGFPVLFIHGGPGAGCSTTDRRYFNPEKWRIILFDQRGSGRSKPFGSIANNTTDHLCDDIDEIYKELGIQKAVLFGGSWGSTLALVFAIARPEKVSGMVLRGIFLGEKSEIDYLWNGAIARHFPEVWLRFLIVVPKEFKKNPAEYYYQQLMSPDLVIRKKVAYEWARFEEALLHLEPQTPESIDKETSSFSFESCAIMEAHYLFKNHCFFKEGFILKNVGEIPKIPISIIQGRYDMVCPPVSAYRLKQKMPLANLHMVTAGHSSSDPEIRKKLISETDAMFDKITK